MLWMNSAIITSSALESILVNPGLFSTSMCGMLFSIRSSSSTPVISPSVRAIIPDSLIACGIKPKVDAETIIPAVKATSTSFQSSDNFRTNRIGTTPSTVAIADKKLPSSAFAKAPPLLADRTV
ncbi:hypothetical protein D3C73_847370 [compost metagenome]